MMQSEMPQCEHGSPAIMMRIAGTEANMKNMVIWQSPGRIQLYMGWNPFDL